MASEARPFSFVQLSDVHLDSKTLALGLPLTEEQRHRRQYELLETFARTLDLARERGAEAVFVVGDLWENETVTASTVTAVQECCEVLGDIPIIIAPGNRDPYTLDSPYNPSFAAIRGLNQWPENVLVFHSSEFQTLILPNRPDVSITARAFTSGALIEERLLDSMVVRADDSLLQILLFHGFLDGYSGFDGHWTDKQTATFSWQELNQQNFTYAALGHCHDFLEVRTDSGTLLGAYSGCLGARTFDELGPRCAIWGVIEPNQSGRCDVQLEPIEMDSRRFVMVAADISGLSLEDIEDEITLNIEDQGGRPNSDIVYLHLEGQFPPGYNPQVVVDSLRDRYPELVVVDNTHPDYLSEDYDRRTTEWRYIESLLATKKKLEITRTEGAARTKSELSSSTVETALYYGLDALKQKKVTLRNVD